MDTTTKTPKACIGDMFPSVFPGMPMFAYVPNPYDCGRPAKVYPGDNTYYCSLGGLHIWPPRRTLYETNAFPIILDSRCRNNGKSHTLGTFPYVRARLQAPRWGCDGGPVRIVGPPRAVPPKGTLNLPFRQLIFGARLAGTEVKRGWRFSPCSKYYPGGVEICGAEKILPDLYFCDGQAIMSMKLTEGST